MSGTRRGLAVAAAGGGAALAVALWLPWFHRKLSSVFAPVRAVEAVSGWSSLGAGAGVLLLAVAAVGIGWGIAVARGGKISGSWLVLPAGLALFAEVGATVARVGADTGNEVVITTTPAIGLVVAYAAAVALALAGLWTLLRQSLPRA